VQELQALVLVRRVELLQELVQHEENRRQSGGTARAVRASIEATLACLRAELAKTQRRVQQQVERSAQRQDQQHLLCSIPGGGRWTAARVLAEIAEIRGALSARQLAAYAGLTPAERTSGSSVHHPPRLATTGTSRLRRARYLPAIVAMRYQPAIQALAARRRARGKRPMVIVGAAMRKLLHLIYGVLTSGTPFDSTMALAA
jgi:transposase